jgi:signal transduction histidine kinase
VIRDGKVVYVLSVVLKVTALNALLANWPLPPEWAVVVADENNTIIARSLNPESTGKPLSATGQAAARSGDPNHVYKGVTREGYVMYAAFQISPLTKWSVHIGVPETMYEKPVEQLKLILVIGSAIAIGLTSFFVLLLIKELRRRQRELQLLEQKLRLESLGELTGRVAHDFNNLLFVISGNVELLAKSVLQPCPRLEAIHNATARGLRLTNDLLSFSRGGSSVPQTLELSEHVGKLVRASKERFPKNINIMFDMNGHNLYVEVDLVQFEMAILNLIINACDAMPDGGSTKVIARKEKEWISLTICDGGHGISPDVLPHIFDPFFTTKGDKGNGFGLSQVYGFIKTANGTISVESEKTGTTITIRLPAAGNYKYAA